MKKNIIWVLLMLVNVSGYAQCDEKMYELTTAKAGKDVVLVRDFKVTLKEGNKRNPSPTSKFSVLMQKGLTYRFIISKDKSSLVDPILQLMDRNEILETTFDSKNNRNLEHFEYQCSRTGTYKVFISINESRAGCGIGLMAMVTDSAYYAQGNYKVENDQYILYTDIANPLNIITYQKGIKKTIITSDRGLIKEKDSAWYIIVASTGPININVKLYNYADSVIEEIDQKFNVISLPKPEVFIEGSEREFITKSWLGPSVKLIVKPSIYKILEFYLSTDLAYNTGLRSNTEYLSSEMLDFIKSLDPQQKIYIKDIQLIGPEGLIVNPKPILYYVR
jgi:hypothetical protein